MTGSRQFYPNGSNKPIDLILDQLKAVRESSDGFEARCPSHDDRVPSLSLREGDDGRALVFCHAGCSTEAVVQALGLSMADLFPRGNRQDRRNGHRGTHRPYRRSWEIRDIDGNLVAVHVRNDRPDGDKDFVWKRPGEPKGLSGLKSASLPLYGTELLKDLDPKRTVVITEGEKAADALRALEVPALGSVTGASGTPSAEALEVLRGRTVILWPDADGPGRQHMERIGEALREIAASLKVYEWDGAPFAGADAADHPAVNDGNREAIEDLLDGLREVPAWRPTPTPRRTFTAAELMETALPPARFAIPGILPEGVTILAGRVKTGKSWLAMGACIAVASGGYVLGTRKVDKGSALYLALEDNRRRLKSRMSKLLAGGPPPEGLDLATDWPRLDQGGAEEIDAWLRDHPDARLVVIDTLKKIRPRASANRSVYDVDYEALEPLIPVAARHGVAIVVVHHLRKLAASDPLDEISGSTGLTGGVDGLMVLRRDRGRHDAALYVTGRDVEEDQELALRWDHETASWTLIGDAAEYRMSQERQNILDALRSVGRAVSTREIADLVDNDYNATRKTLQRMDADGLVEVAHTKGRANYYVVGPNSTNSPNTSASGLLGHPNTRHQQAEWRSGNPDKQRKNNPIGTFGTIGTPLDDREDDYDHLGEVDF